MAPVASPGIGAPASAPLGTRAYPDTMPDTPTQRLSLSIVIPILNEADNIDPVIEELAGAFAGHPPFEVLCVDDGSTDGTAARVRGAMGRYPWLRLVRHDRTAGKSRGLRTAAEWARGDWIVTMDGDGQNIAADIRGIADRLPALVDRPSPLVAGIRRYRRDTLSRRIATRIANPIRRRLLSDDCPDSGCGIKAFRRDAFLRLPVFEGMHRFLPALFGSQGHPLICHPVDHRERRHGRSKYTNLGRAVAGIFDLLGVIWLRGRTRLTAVDGDDRTTDTWTERHDPF